MNDMEKSMIIFNIPNLLYRHEIQGMAPPMKRNTEQFDAGAKYHVAADVGYVRDGRQLADIKGIYSQDF